MKFHVANALIIGPSLSEKWLQNLQSEQFQEIEKDADRSNITLIYLGLFAGAVDAFDKKMVLLKSRMPSLSRRARLISWAGLKSDQNTFYSTARFQTEEEMNKALDALASHLMHLSTRHVPLQVQKDKGFIVLNVVGKLATNAELLLEEVTKYISECALPGAAQMLFLLPKELLPFFKTTNYSQIFISFTESLSDLIKRCLRDEGLVLNKVTYIGIQGHDNADSYVAEKLHKMQYLELLQGPDGVYIGSDEAKLPPIKENKLIVLSESINNNLSEMFMYVRWAGRIWTPSYTYFLRKWTDPTDKHQEFIRKNYWDAIKKAQDNRENALKLMQDKYAKCKMIKILLRPEHVSGFNSVFDNYSGAIIFRPGDYEFDLHGSLGCPYLERWRSKLYTYFEARLTGSYREDRPNLKRRLLADSKVLLRGDVYYTNLKQIHPYQRALDYSSEMKHAAHIIECLIQESEVFNKIHMKLYEEKYLKLFKLTLGFCDQLRNFGLIYLSAANQYLERFSEGSNRAGLADKIKASVSMVEFYYDVMLGACILDRSFSEMANNLTLCAESLNQIVDRCKSQEWVEPLDLVRGWREADHPLENLLVAVNTLKSVTEPSKTAAIGIFWGGVELPIITNYVAKLFDMPLNTYGYVAYGRYSKAAKGDLNSYCNLLSGTFLRFSELKSDGVNHVLLLDDNLLTGKTFEVCRDRLLKEGIENISTFVVRFSGERREGQILMEGKGVVHPDYLLNDIGGFIGETPYSRSYSRRNYTNPLGVFNLARSRILRYLHTNTVTSLFEREGF